MATQGKPKKKADGFNTPFKDLKQKLTPPTPPKPAAPKAPPPPPRPARAPAEPDDAALFLEALDGVRPLTDRGPVKEARPPPVSVETRASENAEALAELAEMVSGQGAFDITGTGESIEGSSPGLDARVMRSLRKGEFGVQGRLDLHGLTQSQARPEVERFLSEARRGGKRCVLLIHGRGLNSEGQQPVLKERLGQWLSEGRAGRMVLAFCTARPQDGGAGAVYVLLRR